MQADTMRFAKAAQANAGARYPGEEEEPDQRSLRGHEEQRDPATKEGSSVAGYVFGVHICSKMSDTGSDLIHLFGVRLAASQSQSQARARPGPRQATLDFEVVDGSETESEYEP